MPIKIGSIASLYTSLGGRPAQKCALNAQHLMISAWFNTCTLYMTLQVSIGIFYQLVQSRIGFTAKDDGWMLPNFISIIMHVRGRDKWSISLFCCLMTPLLESDFSESNILCEIFLLPTFCHEKRYHQPTLESAPFIAFIDIAIDIELLLELIWSIHWHIFSCTSFYG